MSEKQRELRPFPIAAPNRPVLANLNAFRRIDGVVFPKISGSHHTMHGTPPVSHDATYKKFFIGSPTNG